ncbi:MULTISPECIES: hypothetical protein [Bacillaceae]|uniref:hypothetical protein n=1 Tax=Bacillaceae TaxID=186817 RepID=UPI000660AD8E|nr:MULTISPECIES: hypothetical protein [Bacillaceae]MCF7620916.1 hypothetical protein [Peribacillus frigoritolerans]PRA87633.1 hypothetical protein CQ056_14260 [Peribacillus simplex]
MDNKLHISELQEKAFNGDKEALEMYNTYVSRGQAPAISISTKNTSQHSQALMAEGYRVEAEKRGDSLFESSFSKELTEEQLMKADPVTKMSYGYVQRNKAKAEHQEKAKNKQSSFDKAEGNHQEATQSKSWADLLALSKK